MENIKRIIKSFYKRKEIRFYFTCLLYKKYNTNIYDYLPLKKYIRINTKYIYEDKSSKDFLQNKNIFHDFLIKNNLPTSLELARITEKKFISESFEEEIKSLDTLNSCLLKILQNNESVFVKKVYGEGGTSIFRVTEQNLLEKSESIINECLSVDFRIEKEIKQHNDLNKINPNSVNTLRVVTFKDSKNRIQIPVSLLRFGTGKSHVDNASSGGGFISYDLYNNKLDKYAHSFFPYGGKTFLNHPDTHFLFEDQSLPFSNDVIKLVTKSASLLPHRIIGWDIAITPNGPIIVEANETPHLTLLQIGCKGFKRNKIYNKIYNNSL